MVPPVLAIAEPSFSTSGAPFDHTMALPDDVQERISVDGDNECSVDEDPFANSTSVWRFIVMYMLEPVISLLPDEVAPYARENAGTILLAAACFSVLMLVGTVPQASLVALIPCVPGVTVIMSSTACLF